MRIAGKRTQPFLLAAALLLLAARSEAAPPVPRCSKPDWPAEARRYELEGTTTLRVVVGDDGRPTSASVEKAAAAYIQSCRFAANSDAAGMRTDTTYGKLLLKN